MKTRGVAYTDDMIIEALNHHAGNISDAARELGCRRETISRRVSASEKLFRAKTQAEDLLLDLAESNLYKDLKAGKQYATQFTLRSKGQKRGWGTTTKVQVEKSVFENPQFDTDGLSEDDLKKMLDGAPEKTGSTATRH